MRTVSYTHLTEPSWNPQKGLLTVPGSSVAKDPQITNTSELNMNELAALKCEFVYSQNCPDKSKRGKVLSAQDMEKVVQVYTIDYNSDDAAKGEWVRFAEQKKTDPVQYFYYSKVLKRNLNGTGETTEMCIRDRMKENIAKALHMEPDCLNIKATTEEKLGFTGREEGIASQAVCLLYKK